MVGCLIFLEQGVQFDIAYPVGQLTRIMGAPNKEHLAYIKQVDRYLVTSESRMVNQHSTADHPTTPGFDSALTTYVL